ncbi:MAG: hypothetical protein WD512_04805, partial [Candidatus Paceibacterota bacterium]
NVLSLTFNSLALSNEIGQIILKATISNDYKSFSGIKPNKLYAGGLLHYNATFLKSEPTSYPQYDEDDSPCQVRRTNRKR